MVTAGLAVVCCEVSSPYSPSLQLMCGQPPMEPSTHQQSNSRCSDSYQSLSSTTLSFLLLIPYLSLSPSSSSSYSLPFFACCFIEKGKANEEDKSSKRRRRRRHLHPAHKLLTTGGVYRAHRLQLCSSSELENEGHFVSLRHRKWIFRVCSFFFVLFFSSLSSPSSL